MHRNHAMPSHKILPEGNDILTANFLGEELQQISVMKPYVELPDYSNVIEPDEITFDRLDELKFFQDFVVDEHKPFISIDY